MNEINLRVAGQHIEITSMPARLVENSDLLYSAILTFDAAWDGYTKYIAFRAGKIEQDYQLFDDKHAIPGEFLTSGTILEIGVYGTKNGVRMPTIWAKSRVKTQPGPGPVTPKPPPGSSWENALARKADGLSLEGQELQLTSGGKKIGNSVTIPAGDNGGGTGTPGGYYTPTVTDNGDGTITWTAEPSNNDMPELEAVEITLPEGPQGPAGPAGADGCTPVKGVDYNDGAPGKSAYETAVKYGFSGTEEQFGHKLNISIVTPQMFGAKGDGLTDDTAAIQEALNRGGLMYFPPGRYRATEALSAITPGKIVMDGFFPSSYDGGDYPTATDDTFYGARIETTANGVGLLLGDCVSVDGLAIRAMSGFSGVILKYDGSQGIRTYPSQVRLRRIRVDRKSADSVIEAFFDFNPYRTYGVIVEDVVIGSNHIAQFGQYGFRALLTNWANSIRLKDIVIETMAQYPMYIDGGDVVYYPGNWTFENIAIQAYPFSQDFCVGKVEAHVNAVYLRNLDHCYFSGCYIWDVTAAKITGNVIEASTLTADRYVMALGNDEYFNGLDTVNGLNLSLMRSAVTANPEGDTVVTLTDRENRSHAFTVPAASVSDERMNAAVTAWMDDNAAPKPTAANNNLANPEDATLTSYVYSSGMIPCKQGDVVRLYRKTSTGFQLAWPSVQEYNEEQQLLVSHTANAATYAITSPDSAYFKVVELPASDVLDGDKRNIMICLNVVPTSFEFYAETLEGGILEYLILQSPGGTRYRLAVEDDGTVKTVLV